MPAQIADGDGRKPIAVSQSFGGVELVSGLKG